jgi:O-antigen/teichoic acid export membrane protein
MSSTRRHLRNLAFNWGGHISSLLVMFFLSPYIVGKLDSAAYGIWSLLNVLVGYMGIFDLGVRASVGRHVALYLGKKDERGVDETIRAGFAFFSIASILILLAGVILGWLFPFFFKEVPPEHFSTVRYLLPFMAINIWLAAVSTIYSSVLTAHSRFDIARGVDVLVLLVRTAGTIFALEAGWGLWGLASALILANFLALISNHYTARRIHRKMRSLPLLYSRLRMQELFNYGFFSFISSISAKIINQSDLLIVGLLISVSAVREYSIGATLVYYTTPFLTMISRTFFPDLQRKAAAGAMADAADLFYKHLRISFCFGLLTYIGFTFYAKAFITLWMHQPNFDMNAVSAAATVMTLLALSKLPSLYLYPCGNIIAVFGHVRFNAMRSITEAIVNIALSLYFVVSLAWGLAGIAAGTLCARILVSTLSTPIFMFKIAPFSPRKFITSILLPAVIAASIFSLVCRALTLLWPPTTWLSFSLNISSALMIWAIIAIFLLFPRSLRQAYVYSRIKKILD